MRSSINRSVALLVVLTTAALPLKAQSVLSEIGQMYLNPIPTTPVNPGFSLGLNVLGPPNLSFDLFVTTDLQAVPWTHIITGNTGPAGQMILPFTLPQGVSIQQAWVVGIGWIPGTLPGLIEPLGFAAGNPAPLAPWIRRGTIEYRPPTPTEPALASAKAFGCPGDVVQLKRNGVVIASGVIGSNGGPSVVGVNATVNFPSYLELSVGGQTVAGPIYGP
jgi:hypothetical protein